MRHFNVLNSAVVDPVSGFDLEKIDLVSLDVFDTLLMRKVEEPSAVFDVVATAAINAGLMDPALAGSTFRQLRQGAERAARAAEEKKAALEVAKKLEKLELTVSAATTDGKKLYGAVSVSDILAAIEANRGVALERSQLSIEDSLREVGEYEATIDLGHGVVVKFKITILDEQATAEA